MTYCPKCGAPGRLERFWTGEEFAVCDAYRPCGYDLAEAIWTRDELHAMSAVAGSGARSDGASPQEMLRETAQLVLGRLDDSAAPRTRTGAHDAPVPVGGQGATQRNPRRRPGDDGEGD